MSDRATKNTDNMARTKQTSRKKRDNDSDRDSKKPPPESTKPLPETKKPARKQSDKKFGDFVCPTCGIHFNQASNLIFVFFVTDGHVSFAV